MGTSSVEIQPLLYNNHYDLIFKCLEEAGLLKDTGETIKRLNDTIIMTLGLLPKSHRKKEGIKHLYMSVHESIKLEQFRHYKPGGGSQLINHAAFSKWAEIQLYNGRDPCHARVVLTE